MPAPFAANALLDASVPAGSMCYLSEQTPATVSSTTVVVVATGGSVAGGSYLQGLTNLATTHRWTVRYLASRRTDGMGVEGAWR